MRIHRHANMTAKPHDPDSPCPLPLQDSVPFTYQIATSVMDLFSFSTVLWSTSSRLMITLLFYAATGTILAFLIGRRLVGINYEQLRREADLRYSLIRVRENAESIAFYSGEALEGRLLSAIWMIRRIMLS